MDGEFSVRLKNYDTKKIVLAFHKHFGDKLEEAYLRSAYRYSEVLSQADFCAGYKTHESLFLVYNREGNFLKVYVEPKNKKDLNLMKELINRYFMRVTEMLEKEKIKWSKPEATITLEECPLTGGYRTKKDALKEIFENQREKLFLVPIGTILATGIAVYSNITDKKDAGKDVGKAVTSTLEAFIVFILLVVLQWLFTPGKRAFTFKI